MMALKAAAAPRRAQQITSRAIERLLLDGRDDIEIDGQARADRAAGVCEPDHVIAGGEAGNVADHDRVAKAIRNVGESNWRATVAIVPNASMIWPSTPSNARRRTISSRDGC